ncbi:MAG: hypothetical protein P4L53_22870 [Candidatus Obscuribacterales bacterium]|nr:hypothetical protein [Candidatus Obscuribacterales bacterium]
MHDANLFATTLRSLPTLSLNNLRLPTAAAQLAFVATQLTLKLLWSDDIRIILGSTMFYPLLTMTAIFLAAKVSPARIVNKCACFCNRKMRAIWLRVQVLLKKIQAHHTVMSIRRSHLLTSMKVLAGAAEILIF